MNRNQFIRKTTAGLLIAVPAGIWMSCSSSDDGGGGSDNDPNPSGTANCEANGTRSAIGANHGHTLTVSRADVAAGSSKTYSIQGSSTHDHSVTLSADDFTALQANNAITVNSTNDDGHTHSVTVSCA